jgi:hypothetical protein
MKQENVEADVVYRVQVDRVQAMPPIAESEHLVCPGKLVRVSAEPGPDVNAEARPSTFSVILSDRERILEPNEVRERKVARDVSDFHHALDESRAAVVQLLHLDPLL